MTDVLIIAAAPFTVGRLNGTPTRISAADLGAHRIKGLFAKAGLKPEQISEAGGGMGVALAAEG